MQIIVDSKSREILLSPTATLGEVLHTLQPEFEAAAAVRIVVGVKLAGNTLAGPAYFNHYISNDLPAFEKEYLDFITKLTASWPIKIPQTR